MKIFSGDFNAKFCKWECFEEEILEYYPHQNNDSGVRVVNFET
jgi:hypothetical protein